MSDAPAFGIATGLSEDTLQPVELATWLEERGFESLLVGEHTHFPTAPHRYGEGDFEIYKKMYDPFVALTAAATATQRLKVGTAVCLVTEHHPITLAKQVATLDRLSGGRVILGCGTGWNTVELLNHGVAWKDRWKVTHERVAAMREIWKRETAEFHGEFVDFDPIWCRPKPVQRGGPKILLGGGTRPEAVARRVVGWGDGWIPLEGGHEVENTLTAIRAEADRVGRPMEELDLTVGLGLMGPVTEQRIREMFALGFNRVLFVPGHDGREETWRKLEAFAELKSRFV
ncbi:MAG: LLM class F420-dependent oxidoreductase [Deltaproteobacteria bacterium]|jgi:probable F420-dependent oxidoreductase|nr:LLM class F420-dependent oxidoreductase [Deltaproteobacteria bacterium]MBW2500378.1 LLM class F420-dependent oxidoreductase [Deltaproteobacteria bacterium]